MNPWTGCVILPMGGIQFVFFDSGVVRLDQIVSLELYTDHYAIFTQDGEEYKYGILTPDQITAIQAQVGTTS